MPAPDSFSTERLVAHHITLDDQPFLEAMYRDPAVAATLGGPRDGERIVELRDRMVGHWNRCGFGTWILRDRATGEPIERAGLPHVLMRLTLVGSREEVSERG